MEIRIPSNIKGIEQIRYENYDDIEVEIQNAKKNLLNIQIKEVGFFLLLLSYSKYLIQNLEIAIETKKLIDSRLKGKIIELVTLENQTIVIINKGKKDCIKENMIFLVHGLTQRTKGGRLEEEMGLILIKHVQEKFSQGIPILFDPTKSFWKNAVKKNIEPNNVKSYLWKDYNDKSENELRQTKDVLDRMIKNIEW